MFYEPLKTSHGLDHDPFKSCVVPRPIGWISTISKDGIHNLAPYSQLIHHMSCSLRIRIQRAIEKTRL